MKKVLICLLGLLGTMASAGNLGYVEVVCKSAKGDEIQIWSSFKEDSILEYEDLDPIFVNMNGEEYYDIRSANLWENNTFGSSGLNNYYERRVDLNFAVTLAGGQDYEINVNNVKCIRSKSESVIGSLKVLLGHDSEGTSRTEKSTSLECECSVLLSEETKIK